MCILSLSNGVPTTPSAGRDAVRVDAKRSRTYLWLELWSRDSRIRSLQDVDASSQAGVALALESPAEGAQCKQRRAQEDRRGATVRNGNRIEHRETGHPVTLLVLSPDAEGIRR